MNKQQFSHRKSYLFARAERVMSSAEKFVSNTPMQNMTAPDRRKLYTSGRKLKTCHDEAEMLIHVLPQLTFAKPSKHRNELVDIQSQVVMLWRRLVDYANFALLPRFPQLPEYLVEELVEEKEEKVSAPDVLTELEQIMKEE